MQYRSSVNRSFCFISVLAFSLCLAISGCKPKTPSQYIQPDEIEDILVEYHIAKAIAQNEGDYNDVSYRQSLYFETILQKHGVTRAHFDTSMVYYYTRADRFEPIYHRVLERLQDQAAVLGAAEGEIGKYSAFKAEGDTANIWGERSAMLLSPIPPYHRTDFLIAGDSLFREGDTFLLQFMADYMYQSGTKDGLAYMVVEYPDTVLVRQTRFTYSGLIQLRMDTKRSQCPTAIRGFFYLGGAGERSTIMRLLFLNNIQLIRFHKKNEEPAEPATSTQDSMPSVAVAEQPAAEVSSSRDTVRSGRRVLHLNKGNSPNRVVERIDSAKIRR